MAHVSQHVADYIIAHSKGNLTDMHINKLVFLSHGWSLGLRHQPLINEEVEAWKFGPVIPSLYHAFSGYGSNPIDPRKYFRAESDEDLAKWQKSYSKLFNSDELCIIDQVRDRYGDWGAWALSDLTHADGTPWKKYYDPKKKFEAIPNAEIERYYQNLKAEEQ